MPDENPEERQYYLRRTQILNELQGELLVWGKRQFWLLTAIVAVIALGGYFGITNLIVSTVREIVEREAGQMRKEGWEASKAALLAQESAAKAKAAAAEATEQAEAHAKTVAVLRDRATQVDAQFIALQQRLEADSANVRAGAARELKEMAAQLTRLEGLVAKVAQESDASRQAVEAYRKELAQLRDAARAAASRFEANTAYSVTVFFTEQTKDVSTKAVDRLTAAGFKASALDITRLTKFVAERFTSLTEGLTIEKKSQEKEGRQITMSQQIPTANTITYTADAKVKGEEIRNLLAPIAQFKKMQEVTRDEIIGWGDFLYGKSPFVLVPRTNRVSVYLVEKG